MVGPERIWQRGSLTTPIVAKGLNMLLANNDQQKKYYRVWKEILNIINRGHAELKSSKEIRLFAIDDLPIGYVFKIHSMTVVIKSLIEKDFIKPLFIRNINIC